MLLITGAKGQLGLCFKDVLGKDVLYLDKELLDITKEKDLLEFSRKHKFSAIINCAAFTAVDRAEDDILSAQEVNIKGAENLAKLTANLNIPLVHFSTDYVFDGTAKNSLKEDFPPLPINIYGKTKLEGENKILQYAKDALIIRTAWLYSPYGNNFVKTILKLAQTQKEIKVVCDQIGSPTYAPNLANAVLRILPSIKNLKGIYNYTDEGAVSRFDFASYIVKEAGLQTKIVPVLSKDYPSKAKRPLYSVLSKDKIIKDFNLTLENWQIGVKKCLKQLF